MVAEMTPRPQWPVAPNHRVAARRDNERPLHGRAGDPRPLSAD
jgi:hypothetical protein